MEPRHRVPEFQSEFELDYTDNAIYLILKRERIQLVDVGPQVTTARTTNSARTVCSPATFSETVLGKDKPSYQGFLGNAGGRKSVC